MLHIFLYLVAGDCRWGEKDPNRDLKSLPIAKAMFGGLTAIGAPFNFADWNEGRIIAWAPTLEEWLPNVSLPDSFSLTNTPISTLLSRKTETKTYTSRKTRSLSASS